MTALDALPSARPAVTADLMRRTGLDDAMLSRLVHRFYDRVSHDPLLGPVFADRIADRGPHLDRMVEFGPSVALMTGRYQGAPKPKHLPLPVEGEHFDRWLNLFRQTAQEVRPPVCAVRLIERAERIASSIHMNILDARGRYGRAGLPPRL